MDQQATRTTFRRFMRASHRDIGFFVIGLCLLYGLSGIVLIYRGTDIFKRETLIKRNIGPGLDASALEASLRLRDFAVLKAEGDSLYFRYGQRDDGRYNRATGEAAYTGQEYPRWLNRLIALHKVNSRSFRSHFSVVFGLLLAFLALSSFWMFEAGSRKCRRGLCLSAAGVAGAIILILL